MRRTAFAARFNQESVSADKGGERSRRSKEITETRLIAYVLGVLLVAGASLAAIANQSDHFVGVYEVPPFVCERVELVPGLADDRPTDGVARAGAEQLVQDDIPGPGSPTPICARGAGA
jgi:hypothetical protein